MSGPLGPLTRPRDVDGRHARVREAQLRVEAHLGAELVAVRLREVSTPPVMVCPEVQLEITSELMCLSTDSP